MASTSSDGVVAKIALSDAEATATLTSDKLPTTYKLEATKGSGTLTIKGSSDGLTVDLSSASDAISGFTAIVMATEGSGDTVKLTSDQIGSRSGKYSSFTGTLTSDTVDDKVVVSTGTTSTDSLDLTNVTSSNVVFDASEFSALTTLTFGAGHTVKLEASSYSDLPTITGGDATNTVILAELGNASYSDSAKVGVFDPTATFTYALDLGDGNGCFEPLYTTSRSAFYGEEGVTVIGGKGADYLEHAKVMYAGGTDGTDDVSKGSNKYALLDLGTAHTDGVIDFQAVVDATFATLQNANVLLTTDVEYKNGEGTVTAANPTVDVYCSNVKDTVVLMTGSSYSQGQEFTAAAAETVNLKNFSTGNDHIVLLNQEGKIGVGGGGYNITPSALLKFAENTVTSGLADEGTNKVFKIAVGSGNDAALTLSGNSLTINWSKIGSEMNSLQSADATSAPYQASMYTSWSKIASIDTDPITTTLNFTGDNGYTFDGTNAYLEVQITGTYTATDDGVDYHKGEQMGPTDAVIGA